MTMERVTEGKRMTRSNATVIVLLLICWMTHSAAAADDLPLGHPDFYPSPERPVGWRGDGNGAFPGATLVDRFGDGPFNTQDVKDGKKKVTRIWAGNEGPINIAWKHELPGWTMSQPVIVGDRVIQTCEPRTILCLDLKTGKEIWRQELCPFRMLGLEGKELEAARCWEDAAWTLKAQAYHKMGNYTVLRGKAKEQWASWNAFAQQILALLDTVDPYQPALVAQARAEFAPVLKILEGEPSDNHKKDLERGFQYPANVFADAFHKKYGFPAVAHWYSYVGWTWPTPVCDGTWIYVFMNQGQIARLSLKDGSISWLRRISKTVDKLKQPLPRSPILHQGILYMLADAALYALEAETGKELWKMDNDKKSFSVSCISAVGLRMVQMPNGRSILAFGLGGDTQKLRLLDPKTGEILFERPPVSEGRNEPGPSLMSEGDILLFGNTGQALQICDKDGKISITPLCTFKRQQANVQVLHNGQYYGNNTKIGTLNIWDLATGKEALPEDTRMRGQFDLSNYRPGLLVGDRLLGSFLPHMYPQPKVAGAYRFAQQFVIYQKDGSALISRENILDIASTDDPLPMVAPQGERFISKDLPRSALAEICAGIPTTFGWGGMYAQGDRLLIPSTKYLYCIAPALKGLQTDDPAVVERIAKAGDATSIQDYLTSSSAYYRHSAVKRLGDIDATSVSKELKHIALTDPYDEIRVLAVQVLGEPGYALIRDEISKRFTRWSRDERYARFLATFGDKLDLIVLPMVSKEEKEENRSSAMSAISLAGTGGLKLRDTLLDLGRHDQGRGVKESAGIALGNWPKDEKIMQFFNEVINDPRVKGVQGTAFDYLYRTLAGNDRVELLKKVAASNPEYRIMDLASDRLLDVRPRPEGLFAVFSTQAKQGNRWALHRLRSISDPEALTAFLKEHLSDSKNLPTTASFCMEFDLHAMAALDALISQLSKTKDARQRDSLANTIGDGASQSKNVEVRVKAVQTLIGLLSDQGLRERSIDKLKKFGADAAGAVTALQALDVGGNKMLSSKVDDAVQHINQEIEKSKNNK